MSTSDNISKHDKFLNANWHLELSIEHARENNVCLWADEGKQRLAVQLGYYNQMRAFIKETKIKLSSA